MLPEGFPLHKFNSNIYYDNIFRQMSENSFVDMKMISPNIK